MLELRPGCECCDKDLPGDSPDARICSFECTFCVKCAECIGTMLLTHVLRQATSTVRLFTFQENTGARKFYERHGFKAVKFSGGHENEENCPDVLMVCACIAVYRPIIPSKLIHSRVSASKVTSGVST